MTLEQFELEVTSACAQSPVVAFALIKAERRIFGADNTGGWHWHPVDKPESHVPTSQAVTFTEFLGQIEALLKAAPSSG